MERWLEYTVAAEEAGWQVREVLARSLRLSKQMVRRLARTAGVRRNGAAVFLGTRVQPGDVVAVRLASGEASPLRPVAMELDIVYEDDDVLVIDKPAGLLVHPTRRSHVRTLAHGVVHHYAAQGIQARVHPVHRLDRGTSGLVLIARHPHAHRQLERQLQARRLRRRYLAVVQGTVEQASGCIEASIGRHPGDAHLRSVQDPNGQHTGPGAAARTQYRVLQRYPGTTLLGLELETGRTHQIRVHLLHLGHPLLGDPQYGVPTPLLARQALHAHTLDFLQPLTGEPIACEAALPPDMAELVRALAQGCAAVAGAAG